MGVFEFSKTCPNCGSSKTQKFGMIRGKKQRYFCKKCKTTFYDINDYSAITKRHFNWFK